MIKNQFIKFSRERLIKESKISIEPEFLDEYISFKDDFLKKLDNIQSATNIQMDDKFIKDTKDICNKIIQDFNKKLSKSILS